MVILSEWRQATVILLVMIEATTLFRLLWEAVLEVDGQAYRK